MINANDDELLQTNPRNNNEIKSDLPKSKTRVTGVSWVLSLECLYLSFSGNKHNKDNVGTAPNVALLRGIA